MGSESFMCIKIFNGVVVCRLGVNLVREGFGMEF
jgi:hypothetical protein